MFCLLECTTITVNMKTNKLQDSLLTFVIHTQESDVVVIEYDFVLHFYNKDKRQNTI